MKNRHLFGVLLFVFLLIFVFSGCSLVDFFAADALLRAPKLTGEISALQDAVEEAVGVDIELYTPIAGDYRSSYVLFDYDNNGSDEAVVFYSPKNNPSVIHMNLLSIVDDKWCSVADSIGSGTGVYKVDFFNIDKQAGNEIAVTWVLDESRRQKMLSVYKIFSLNENIDNSLASLATIQLSDYIYLDIDSDAFNELVYFYNNDADNTYLLSACVLDYESEERKFVPKSELNFPESIISFVDINYEKINNNFIFYIDCESSNHNYFTEIMIYDYENSAFSLADYEDISFPDSTVRKFSLNCVDFNADGCLDIPGTLSSDGSYFLDNNDDSYKEENVLSFVSWINYVSGDFVEIGKSFVNTFDGYYFDISDLYEYYYLVYDTTNSMLQIRIKNIDEENNLIFSVACEKEDTHGHLLSEFTSDDYEIVISAKGESLNFTKSYILSLITEI